MKMDAQPQSITKHNLEKYWKQPGKNENKKREKIILWVVRSNEETRNFTVLTKGYEFCRSRIWIQKMRNMVFDVRQGHSQAPLSQRCFARVGQMDSHTHTHIHPASFTRFHTISLNFLSMPILLWVSKYDMFYHQEFLTKLVFVLSSILTVWMKSPLQQWAIFHPDTGLIISQKD